MTKTAWWLAALLLGAAAAVLAWPTGGDDAAPPAHAPAAQQEAVPAQPARAPANASAPADENATGPADAIPAPAGDAPANAPPPAGEAPAPPAWPNSVSAPTAHASGSAGPAAAPAVAVDLAFAALAQVGKDPAALKTWLRAIDDPNTPPGVRSDLIEDLNQEGYRDNSHPGKADLPLILARLELIERLLPLAKDPVNRAAFEEAYKDLLEMYVRLGGAPRAAK